MSPKILRIARQIRRGFGAWCTNSYMSEKTPSRCPLDAGFHNRFKKFNHIARRVKYVPKIKLVVIVGNLRGGRGVNQAGAVLKLQVLHIVNKPLALRVYQHIARAVIGQNLLVKGVHPRQNRRIKRAQIKPIMIARFGKRVDNNCIVGISALRFAILAGIVAAKDSLIFL